MCMPQNAKHVLHLARNVSKRPHPALLSAHILLPPMAAAPQFKTGFMTDANRQKLRETFHNRPADAHPGGWEELWQQNVTPWDRNGPSLALRDAVLDNQDLLGAPWKDDSSSPSSPAPRQRKRALVPGCGRGYDVLLLAALGYDAYGLDASATALAAAAQLQQQQQQEEEGGEASRDDRYSARDPHAGKGGATFVHDDFFRDGFLPATGGAAFDLVFDYTFLCALPPERRPLWARRMRELLAPDGHLLCLEWPLGKDPAEGGPPHGLSSELYVQLLRRPGEDVAYDEHGVVVRDDDDDASAGARGDALVRLKHWRPERTHDAGRDTDYVSIWQRSKA